ADDGAGTILTATDPLDSLQLGQLDTSRLERRSPNKTGKDLQPSIHILAQDIERCRPGLSPDPDTHIDRALLQCIITLLRGKTATTTGPHHRPGHASQSDLVGRIEPATCSHGGRDRDQG